MPLAPGAHDIAASELDYVLDQRLIATTPSSPRDDARMLVVRRSSDRIEHARVRDLPDYLASGTRLVVNQTRVAPMRFIASRGTRTSEGLFVSRTDAGTWLVLLKGAKQFRPGERLELIPAQGFPPAGDSIELVRRDGIHWEVALGSGGSALDALERSGRTPLPPYILQARARSGSPPVPEAIDRRDYQTLFAHGTGTAPERASCAAPTAGLHFTPRLIGELLARGVETLPIELQVGTGTFRPLEADRVSQHQMHSERCIVRPGEVERLRHWQRDTNLVVGTTCARLLESLPMPLPALAGSPGSPGDCDWTGATPDGGLDFSTDILIAPGYEFRWVGQLLTNFHLPRSTLMALVGALVGLDRLKALYRIAQEERYRFYSLGDAMLILA